MVAGPLCQFVWLCRWDHSGINGKRKSEGAGFWPGVLAIDMRLHDKSAYQVMAMLIRAGREKCTVWEGEEQNNYIFQLEHSGKKRGGMQC
jgi:hypothetical protein